MLMKKIIPFVSVMMLPGIAFAQEGGLVPCGNPGQPMCEFTHLLDLISNVINYMFILVVPIAAVMFVIIGFRYMTSGGNVKLQALLRSHAVNLLIGIIIVMCSWLLVATLLRSLGVDDAYILLAL